MKNLLTIDIEEWYRNDFPGNDIRKWESFDDRLALQLPYLLALLKKHKQKATFFILGCIAQKYPKYIREIVHFGHEVASHGMYHLRVNEMTQNDFRNDLSNSIQVIEKITRKKIIGFRAPYWSVKLDKPKWFYQELIRAELTYSSSLFPIDVGFYGDNRVLSKPQKLLFGSKPIWEFPASAASIMGIKIPIAAGIYFRFYPYWVTKKVINWYENSGNPMTVIIHNWELDPYHTKLPLKFPYSLGHYGMLHQFMDKFEKLLQDYRCISIRNYLEKR